MTRYSIVTAGWLLLIASLSGGCNREDASSVDPASTPAPNQLTQQAGDAQDAASPSQAANSKQQRFIAASRLIDQGELDQAEKVVQGLLIEAPDDLSANAMLVTILAERQQFAAAADVLDRLSQVHPDERNALQAQAADLLFEGGDAEAAIARFNALVQRDPRFDDARRRLAQLLNLRGFRFDANEHLRFLAGHAPLTIGELRGLSFPLRPWTDFTEKPNIEDAEEIASVGVLNAARALRSQGDVRDCLTLLSASDLLQQRHPAAVALFGWALADSQQYDQLREWVADAEVASRRYPELWLAAGGLALHEKSDAAIACFAEAIHREPSSLDAHNSMVQALESAGDDEAAKDFKERSRLVRHVQRLTRRIVTNPELVQEDYSELAQVLSAIGRPLESVLWQELLIQRIAPTAPQLAVLRDYKPKVLSQMPTGRDEAVLLCGMKRESLPSAEAWLAQLQQDTAGLIASGDANAGKVGLPPQPTPAPPTFQNVAASRGLEFRYFNAEPPVERNFRIFEAYGSGVACLDYDVDGRLDFYLGQGGGSPPETEASLSNVLYRNLGERFSKVTDSAGVDDRRYTTGITAGDWNQDGLPDLAVGNLGANRLFINQGDGTFREQHLAGFSTDATYTTSLAIADVTGDALPELVEINYLDDPDIFDPIEFDDRGKAINLPGPLHFSPAVDRLFVSQGNGTARGQTFTNTEPAFSGGVEKPAAFVGGITDAGIASTGLGVLVTDIDGTVGNEVFVANDLRANQFWFRDSKLENGHTFVDAAVARGVAYGNSGMAMACMGIAAADFDGNGRLDLHITNFEDQWSNHYMQNETGTFVDQIVPYGLSSLSRKMLGFGAQAFDYDNNTSWDLVVGNGHVEDLTYRGSLFAMPTQLFARSGSHFVEMRVAGDKGYWDTGHWSRALATCDWNRDGRVDFAVTDLKHDFALLENQTATPNHWLQIELVGTESERDAIGASVAIEFAGRELVQVAQAGDGYLSKNESVLFFGLGESESVDRVKIRWPSGTASVFENVDADGRVLLIEKDPSMWRR